MVNLRFIFVDDFPLFMANNTHAKMAQESRNKTMALADDLRYPQNRFMKER
jgi:hypothetical protein